jgi:hypothetical protein
MQRSLTQTSKSFGPQSSEGQAATYNISITDASNTFSLTGTVTTDGTIGVLQAANITDWNLTMDVGLGNSTVLHGPVPPWFVTGNDFSANATSLFFNFADAAAAADVTVRGGLVSVTAVVLDNTLESQQGVPYIHLQMCDFSRSICRGVWLSPSGNQLDQQNQLEILSSGYFFIARATPLPSALPLLATGLGVLGLLGWRRKRKLAA